jgi:DNA polymerase-1
MIALLDGDIIAYRAAAISTDRDQALWNVHQTVAQWRDGAGCDECIVALTSRPSFRYDLYPEYKANRKDKPKPEFLSDCMKELEAYPWLRIPNTEGDDVLGIVSTRGWIGDHVIVTVDKDLLQIPGMHWHPDKGEQVKITEDEADYLFHMQWLMGDSTDNIPGIPKVGPAKATKFLEGVEYGQRTLRVLQVYREYKLDPEYALTMGRLVRILTAPEYDGEKIRMWHYLENQAILEDRHD